MLFEFGDCILDLNGCWIYKINDNGEYYIVIMKCDYHNTQHKKSFKEEKDRDERWQELRELLLPKKECNKCGGDGQMFGNSDLGPSLITCDGCNGIGVLK